MNIIEGSKAKTTIQHLLFLNQKSIVQVCKELKITPQQFSDWIKKRRPIPVERLNTLKTYFNIDESYLVNEERYAKDMSALVRVELEMLVISRRLEQSESEEDKSGYRYMINKLEGEKERQIRIARIAALLQTENEKIKYIIDFILDKLEKGDFNSFEELMK
ncbi:MAG: XRE family transcriptional regulator [Candidatus Caldatribacteriota bacterium]|nr:XRE family transcriptional regulator [Candidatus Caldatribacteriota bacterium]